MKKVKIFAVALVATVFATTSVKAQGVSVSAGADFVSSYVWRGLPQTGAAFQPSISLSTSGFSLGAWGSTSLVDITTLNFDNQYEFDLYASYEIGNLSFILTDYYFAAPDYFDYSNAHVFEIGATYTISDDLPLSLAWYTNFAGDDDFSSYFEVGYGVTAGEVNIDFAVGLTPWSGAYSDDFALINTSITASKEIKITDSFSIPAFAQAIVNPDSKQAYIVFGVSF